MSKEFIEKKYNSIALNDAVRQQKQLTYFTTSNVQEDIRADYFEQYVDRKYYTNDVFLNYVKQVLKTDNFKSFLKYYRKPNPASKLINTRIKEPLSRVFFSEDSYFNYVINGEYVEHPIELEDDFEEKLFNAVFYSYNDVIVHDLSDVNKPYRCFVSIDKVVSIKVEGKYIKKIAYCAETEINDEKVYGYAYIDDEKYEFYDKDYNLVISTLHDYELCPATFVVDDRFYPVGDENDPQGVVKKSFFSYLRSELEEYTFLKTLQKLTDSNGAFPIVTKVETKEISQEGEDFDALNGEPMSVLQLGSQASKEARSTAGSGGNSQLQPGTVISVPAVEKADGSIDVELSKNFFKFHYTPVEILEFINKRIKETEQDIIVSAIGDYSEKNDVSMTELQAKQGYVSREDKLRWLSSVMSFSRQNSDRMMLSLAYGKDNVKADIFYGSDFFLETQDKLYEMFKMSPNAIERKNILIRLSQRRNLFNREKSKREVILYKLMPYASDKDFELAISQGLVDETTFKLQTQFSYWIALFEANYGNIVSFWNSMNTKESEKIILLNNLITNFINNGKETTS